MNALAGVLVLVGIVSIVLGIGILAGGPWAMIAAGVASLVLAAVVQRGVRRV